jgi:hypothetical protein
METIEFQITKNENSITALKFPKLLMQVRFSPRPQV